MAGVVRSFREEKSFWAKKILLRLGPAAAHLFFEARASPQRAGLLLHGWGQLGQIKARRDIGWIPPGRFFGLDRKQMSDFI